MEAGLMRTAIRHAGGADLGAVEALETATFSLDRLSRRSLKYFLTVPTATVLLAETGRVLDGYGLTAFRKGSKIARLYSIAIAAHAAGKGLGRVLLAACEADAQARGARVMRLEVRPDNAAAIRLYQGMGYVQFGRIEDYYEDDTAALRFEKGL